MKYVSSSKLLLIVISLFLSAIFAEIGLRIIFPNTYFLDWHSDEFHKIDLLSHIKNKQSLGLKEVVYDENLGWRMQPYYRSEGVIHNSKGFRSNKEYSKESPGPRIFAVGDSYTYGLGVYNEDTYTSRLEAITGIEVINAGVIAYGLDQAYLMWELEGKKLNPSIVLLGYFVDDFYRNALTVNGRPKPHFIKNTNSEEFELKWVPAPKIETLMKNGELNPSNELRIVQALNLVQYKIVKKFHLRDNSAYRDYNGLIERAELSEYLLIRIKESVEQSGGRLVVLIFGINDLCYGGQAEYQWIENSIVEVCEENDIDYINIAALMRKEKFFLSYYSIHCHLTEGGHRFVTEAIVDAIGLKTKTK